MTFHRPDPHQPNIGIVPIRGGGEMMGKLTGTGSGGVEEPDSLRSYQVAKLVDVLGEGPNRGIVGFLKGIYFNGIPLQNADGTYNYTNAMLQEVLGWPDNQVIPGFEAQQSEVAVSAKVKKAFPITKIIANLNTDRVRVTVSTDGLAIKDDKDNIKGTVIQYRIEVNNNSGGFVSQGNFQIKGKTSSVYQRANMIALPRPGPWEVRVTRITEDAAEDDENLRNDLYWESYTEIVDAKINYSHSHAVGIIIDAEQFGSIPSRTYLVDGRIIQVPNNYNPDTRTYTGVWTGTFKNAWTNNPAWILYDLVTSYRYGLGQWLTTRDASGAIIEAGIDKWALYEIAKWCDEPVPNGIGGYEPRFVCNVCINDRDEAFNVLTRIASVFRGFVYWTGGMLTAVADMPREPAGIYSAANVIGGSFQYQGADIRSLHNMVIATWHDPLNLGETRMVIAEDPDSISKYGIQDQTIEATGATTQSQALRAAKWMMFTDSHEAEVVQFAVGLDGAWSRPGDVISIADRVIGGERRGGRVASATQSSVTLDGKVTITAGQTAFLSCVIAPKDSVVIDDSDDIAPARKGSVETLRVTSVTPASDGPGGQVRSTVNVFGSFSQAPRPTTPWVLASGDLQTTTWRVISIEENDEGYAITAMLYHPDKWGVIEQNMILSVPDISNIVATPPAVTNFKVVENIVQTGIATVGVVALVSWTSKAPAFDVDARPDSGNWIRRRVQTTATEIEVNEGWWEFQVTPVSSLGRKGPTTSIRQEIIGRFAPPEPPQQFRVVVSEGLALFRWLPATEIDVIVGGHYELQFLPRIGGDIRWEDGQTVIDSIPGNSTSCESFYQVGTYMLRTFDIAGLASPTFAMIAVTTPDTSYSPFHQVCESPAWTGTKTNTEVNDINDQLIIGPDLSTGQGVYEFANSINMGRLTTTRLTWDMLAFPFYPGEVTMDERAGNVNDWPDWDSTSSQLGGWVDLEIRDTQVDPTLGEWSEWRPFSAGETTGWGFEFRAILNAPPTQNIGIERLCILADIRNKIDEGGDVPYPAAKQTIMFNIDFYGPPAVTITIQEALAGDHVVLTNKTDESFDIEILSGAGAQVTRTFDWHAMGY